VGHLVIDDIASQNGFGRSYRLAKSVMLKLMLQRCCCAFLGLPNQFLDYWYVEEVLLACLIRCCCDCMFSNWSYTSLVDVVIVWLFL